MGSKRIERFLGTQRESLTEKIIPSLVIRLENSKFSSFFPKTIANFQFFTVYRRFVFIKRDALDLSCGSILLNVVSVVLQRQTFFPVYIFEISRDIFAKRLKRRKPFRWV